MWFPLLGVEVKVWWSSEGLCHCWRFIQKSSHTGKSDRFIINDQQLVRPHQLYRTILAHCFSANKLNSLSLFLTVFPTNHKYFVDVNFSPTNKYSITWILTVALSAVTPPQEAALRHNTKTPRYLHIASNKTNRWGHQRSYRLQVYSFAGDHLPESEAEERSMSWAR